MTVGNAITSALNQTERDVEVLVYDDGSGRMDGCLDKGRHGIIRMTPKTPEIMEKFTDGRVKYFRSKKNRGAATARNTLMAKATGEYCMWLDSDDVANKWRTELSIKAIEELGAPYVRTGVTTFTRDPSTWKKSPMLVYLTSISFATVTFRRSNSLEFSTEYTHMCEDMDWELRYAEKYGPPRIIPLTLYGIGRKSPDRLTDRYKNPEHTGAYEADKSRYLERKELVEGSMKAVGLDRNGRAVPWSFISPFLEKWYGKHYG